MLTTGIGPQAHEVAEARAERTGGRQLIAALGAIGAAILASLCCIGPVLFVTLGVGAGLASRFDPLRPLFTGLTLALLAVGFYTVYGRKSRIATGTSSETCTPNRSCTPFRSHRRDVVVLWMATVIAMIVLTFPQWSLLFV